MQCQRAALLQQRSYHRAEEKEAQRVVIAFRVAFNDDFRTVPDQEASHAINSQQELSWSRLVTYANTFGGCQRSRHHTIANQHVWTASARSQFRARKFSGKTQAKRGV